MKEWINLHSHSEASISDGLFHPKKWVEALKQKGYFAHALTDHGSMASLLPFYHLMKGEGLSPILGVEFYFVADPLEKSNANRKNSHLILLAKNYEGFRNLCKLSYHSYNEGYYYKPRIGYEWLAKYSEGLICLTACQGGILAQEVWAKLKERPSIGLNNVFEKLHAIFGEDLYVEFQGHNTISHDDIYGEFDSQALINMELYEKLKDESGFKQIVTNDCHYILPEHAGIQKLIKNISYKSSAGTSGDSATVNKDHFTDSLWLKNKFQVYDSFRKHHEYLPSKFVAQGIANTLEVFEKCKDFELPKGKKYLPTYRKDINSKEYFKNLCVASLNEFIKSDRMIASRNEYVQRFAKEFKVISKYNLEDYFLIIWDIINYAKSKGISTGLGRGSAAGCLISYLLGIVKIDPLEFNLIFERFLNESRCEYGELPDVDMDFESESRRLIKDYVFNTYGRDKVCEIGTYMRMKLRTALIDFGKALGAVTQKEILAITTELDLDKDDANSADAAAEFDPKLKMLFSTNKEFEFVVKEIIGQVKSQGIHPAGVIICSEKIADITPLKTQKKNLKPEDIPEGVRKCDLDVRVVTTQSEDKHLIAQGLMKIDLLGVKEYDVIKYVIDNADTGLTIDNYAIELQKRERNHPDALVWRLFQQGKSDGVFQFSSSGMKDLLIMMKPDCLGDLIAANALYRPGCLENGWHIQYCKRKHGEEDVTYTHPDVEAVLRDTYGLPVFQEQFMEVLHRLGGISMIEADTIRSALGKKDKEKLNKFKKQFVIGASEKIGERKAISLWDQLEKASGYSFNKSHSAAYSVLAYISQYFKAYYPEYFWAAQIDYDVRKNKMDDMLSNRRAASDMGVTFVLPHINRSKANFYVDGKDVVWSFVSVKGIGQKAAKELAAKQPYSGIDDFYKRIDKKIVKYNNLQSLTMSGVFDEFGDRREILQWFAIQKKDKKFKPMSEQALMMEFYNSMGFVEIKLKKTKSFSKNMITEQELIEYDEGSTVRVGGMISDVRSIKTKNKDTMGFFTIMDLDEIIEVTAFPESWKEFRPLIKIGNIVEVTGTKSCYKGRQNMIEVQDMKIV